MLSASGSWPRLPSGLAALAYRDYRLIWTGQVISNVGSSMQQLGLGWLIVQLATRDGASQLMEFAPTDFQSVQLQEQTINSFIALGFTNPVELALKIFGRSSKEGIFRGWCFVQIPVQADVRQSSGRLIRPSNGVAAAHYHAQQNHAHGIRDSHKEVTSK